LSLVRSEVDIDRACGMRADKSQWVVAGPEHFRRVKHFRT
jgi:hypothetical protein